MCRILPGWITNFLFLVSLGKGWEAWVYIGDFYTAFDSASAGWADDPQSEISTEEFRTECYSQNEDCSKGTKKTTYSYTQTHTIAVRSLHTVVMDMNVVALLVFQWFLSTFLFFFGERMILHTYIHTLIEKSKNLLPKF